MLLPPLLLLLLLLLYCTDAPPQLPSWMSEEILRSLSNVLLELPFSRRAETEADLIGEQNWVYMGGLEWGVGGGEWGAGESEATAGGRGGG
jgi:hypothetical protein